MFFKKYQKKELNLVHDEDLEELLKDLGVLESFLANKKKCKFCKKIVNKNNLHSIFKESGEIKFICDNPGCIKELTDYLD